MRRAVLAAALFAAVLTGCSGPRATESAVQTHWLRVADGNGDIPTLNPHLYNGTTVQVIAQLAMAYLVRYDAESQPQPELATEVPTRRNGGISADGKTIVFHLRHGVRWSDGAPFTADDVVFSSNVVRNPANDEITREGFDLIEKIDEPDKFTVVYHLKRPYALFEPIFFGAGAASPCILPVHILGREPNVNHVAYDKMPVGIGPFRVVRWKLGDRVELEANPFYWRGLPKLRHVTYRLLPSRDAALEAMQTGEIDLWPGLPPIFVPRVQAIEPVRTIVKPAGFWSGFFFNVTRPLVSDQRVREAVRAAVDRQAIVSETVAGNGILQEAMLSPVVPAIPRDIPMRPFDPALARRLLDAGGWKTGPGGVRVKDGRRLFLIFAYSSTGSVDATAAKIRSDLAAVGIAVQLRRYPPARYFASFGQHGVLMRGDWDVATFAWDSEPNGSLENIFGCKRIPPNGQNITRYCDAVVDALLWRFTMTYDPVQRARLEEEIERRLIDAAPAFTLYVWKQGYAFSSHLTNYRPGNMAPFGDLMTIDI